MSAAYIGPERRQQDRRLPARQHMSAYAVEIERRSSKNRRQQALSGVIAGLTAEEMEQLAVAWRAIERAPTQPEGG